eukprot:897431-Rhodomonas_salina.2
MCDMRQNCVPETSTSSAAAAASTFAVQAQDNNNTTPNNHHHHHHHHHHHQPHHHHDHHHQHQKALKKDKAPTVGEMSAWTAAGSSTPSHEASCTWHPSHVTVSRA